MTGPYEWSPMPHVLEVRCPSCAGPAVFEFAEVARIARKTDIPFFRSSPHFEYRRFPAQGWRQAWHGAIYFPGLTSRSPAAARLPEGYSPEDWAHPKYFSSRDLDLGTLTCQRRCARPRKHRLVWPGDAFFSIEYRRALLWAFDRGSATELRDFIASPDREASRYRWRGFLMKVPGRFLQASARAELVRRLDRLLAR